MNIIQEENTLTYELTIEELNVWFTPEVEPPLLCQALRNFNYSLTVCDKKKNIGVEFILISTDEKQGAKFLFVDYESKEKIDSLMQTLPMFFMSLGKDLRKDFISHPQRDNLVLGFLEKFNLNHNLQKNLILQKEKKSSNKI